MSCECPEPKDCCQDCPDTPAPVMPRCNNALTDGTYTNATVVVEGGCITGLTSGRVPQYAPTLCCDDSGGGEGEPGPQGPAGAPGRAATITVGSVNTVPSTQPASVTNVGSTSAAILNFNIPKGEPGSDGTGATGVNSQAGGIVIEKGLIKVLPAAWPPAGAFTVMASPGDVNFSISQPDPNNGVVSVNLDLTMMISTQQQWTTNLVNNTVDPVAARVTALESQVQALTNRVNACCP